MKCVKKNVKQGNLKVTGSSTCYLRDILRIYCKKERFGILTRSVITPNSILTCHFNSCNHNCRFLLVHIYFLGLLESYGVKITVLMMI